MTTSDTFRGHRSLIKLGNCEVSRLVVGHNPLCGNSHLSSELNEQMTEYFSDENVLKLYHRAEELGIRTFVIRGDYRMLGWLELYRRQGGSMNVIGQTASEMHDVLRSIRVMAAAGVEAIHHHGTETDRLYHMGRINDCLDRLKCARDCGVAVGLGTHMPEVIEYAEEHGWDVDYYLACLYNLSRRPRESAIVSGDDSGYADEEFLPEDRRRMFAAIQATPRPALAFKILAAGRLCDSQESVRVAFADAYSNIKPRDGVVVGLFPKRLDQVQLDLDYAEKACLSATKTG